MDDFDLEVNGAEEEVKVIDDTENDLTVSPVQYEMTSYGADIDAEGFVNRLRRDDVFIPPFQRDYVWTQREASRFIESLLLGLPVPGVFLAREHDSKRLIVIDGQQRLKTLLFFFDGYFNPQEGAKRKRVFDLQYVQNQFDGRTYETLDDEHRITLNDAVIHATIVKQDAPSGDNSAVYHIFERLNNSGRRLSPQQIRVAIYHGFVIDALHELNEDESWREIYGRRSKTLKDEELILRFFGLYHFQDSYSRPMKDFLNDVMEKLIRRGQESLSESISRFRKLTQFVRVALGTSAFRPERALNAAVFDSIMIGLARRLERDSPPSPADFRSAYEQLLKDAEYSNLVSRATADDNNVSRRLEMATAAFVRLSPADGE